MNDRIELPEHAPDAATIGMGSDRYPATVISDDGKIVLVQHDDDRVISGSGHDGSARYAYYRNENGAVSAYQRDREGRFYPVVFNNETKRYNKVGRRGGLYIGRRDRYYDPHF